MKKLLVFLLVISFWSCKGKTGPIGANGANGSDGSSKTNVYTARFQTGVNPSTNYNGTTLNRLDTAHQGQNYPNDGNLLFSNSSAGEESAILVKFNVAGLIPSNATITTAAIELVATAPTSLTGPVTIGVHQMGIVPWTYQANWIYSNGSLYWTALGQAFGSYCYGSTMGTAVLPVSYTGATNRIGLDVSTATIAAWMNGNNTGLAIISENEGADATGTAVFSTPTDSNVSYRPVLEVNYTL